MNPAEAFKLIGLKRKFDKNHPKFQQFLRACLKDQIKEGTVIEISVKNPDGAEKVANLKVLREDLEMFEELKNMKNEQM